MGTSPRDNLHSNTLATDMGETQPNIQMKGWETPNILTQGGLFHCLTTQANTDAGRPPPQHTDVDQAMGSLGTRKQTVPTMAIPPTIPYQRTPRRMAPHHTNTKGTAHGIPRQLHTTDTGTTVQRQTEEYHARQRMALTDSYMVTLPITDPNNSTHSTITKDNGIRPDDTSLAQQSPTLWPPSQDTHQRQHATARLAIPPEMG